MANKKIKILYWDIEKAPGMYWGWDNWNPPFGQVEPSSISCFAYKWAGSKEAKTIRHSKRQFKLDFRNDKALVEKMAKVIEKADILVAHNGDKFDWKVFNAKVVEHGLPPVKKPLMVDTLKMARSQFKFDSNSLGNLCRYLKIPLKIETSKNLFVTSMTDWKKYMELVEYCAGDVIILEPLHNKLDVYCKPAYNKGRYEGKSIACSHCGSEDLVKNGHWLSAATGQLHQRYQCKTCGSRANVESAGKKKRMRGII